MQNEASLKSTMLAQRYAVLETDYRLAQDALQESKKVAYKLESAYTQEVSQKQEANSRIDKEVMNNKRLLKELSKANQTIGRMKQ